MSAETLRDAAREIRTDVSATDRWSDSDVPFVLNVAEWLDGCAARRDVTSDARIAHDPEEQAWYWPALTVARAYLGLRATTPPTAGPSRG